MVNLLHVGRRSFFKVALKLDKLFFFSGKGNFFRLIQNFFKFLVEIKAFLLDFC